MGIAITNHGETTLYNRLYPAGDSASRVPPPSLSTPRTSSVSSYKANVHISGPSAAAAALGLPKNFGPSFSLRPVPSALPLSLLRTFLEDCVRKCVSGMMHGGRDQKGRKEEGGGRRREEGGEETEEEEEEVQEGTPETKGRN